MSAPRIPPTHFAAWRLEDVLCHALLGAHVAWHNMNPAALASKTLWHVGACSLLYQPGICPVILCRTRMLPVKLTRHLDQGQGPLAPHVVPSACMHVLSLGDMHRSCCHLDRFPSLLFKALVAMTLSRPDRHHPREQVLGVGGG